MTTIKDSGSLVVERTFAAPVARVWRVITSREDMKHWFFDLAEFEPRVGFVFRFEVLHNGFNYIHHCRVMEAVPNKKLAFTWRYEGYEGDSLVTIELFPDGDKTRLKLTHEGLDSFPKIPAFAKTNFMEGWTAIIGTGLKEFLESNPNRKFVISRTFDAPRELVWKAWTERDRLMQWFGPKGSVISKAEMDFRPGGIFHYCMRTPDGKEMWGKFVYREIVAPERIVLVNSFSDERGGITRHPFSATWPLEMLSTTTLTEEHGKTKLTIEWTPLHPTDDERNTFESAHGGMTQGWGGTFEQLADYLAKIQK